jgi:hypothetical protein
MKHMAQLTTTVILAGLVLAGLATADVPHMINYQGRLTNSSGYPFDGNATMMFSIWDDSTGGNQLWDETHGVVAVSEGLFNVLLGSTDAIPDTVFAQPNAWLNIIANGNQMQPRTQIVSVGYAYHALHSDTADFASNLVPSLPFAVKSSTEDAAVISSPAAVDSVTVDVPSPGYVIVTSSGLIMFTKNVSDESGMSVSISESHANYGPNEVTVSLAPSMPQEQYRFPYSVTHAFPVSSAGSKTFYTIARIGQSTSCYVQHEQLTALYVSSP